MRIPIIQGIIDRRILVNYRVDPTILARQLPAPFRPKLVAGMGMAGICMIRLKRIRPRGWPAVLGISSENAAHRLAVEWDQGGKRCDGVFIPRRDSSSRLNALVGGRLFPGVHHHSMFWVGERGRNFRVELTSDDRSTRVLVHGCLVDNIPPTSVFASVEQASDFFKRGSLGYSVSRTQGHFDGLELQCSNWRMQPLDVAEVESSFFDDRSLFPAGSIEFDCALVMQGIHHEWHATETLCSPAAISREHLANPHALSDAQRPQPCRNVRG